ncbi:MAG: NAD(P)/FAD-dependent oxidoreductase [Caldisphaera sp.]
MSELPKKIVIAGGGAGGYAAAKRISEEIKKRKLDAEVLVVNKDPYHYMPPLFFDVAFNYGEPEDTRAPVANMEKYGIKTAVDEIQKIDAANRTVIGAKGKYQYDYLIVSLGTDQGWNAYPGLDKDGVHNFSLEGAQEMRKALAGVKDNSNIVVLVPEFPYRCGIYPYEASTMLSLYTKQRGKKTKVTLLDPIPAPIMPVPDGGLGPEISRFLKETLDEYGVEYVPNSKLKEVDVQKKTVVTSSGEFKYDLLVKVPPARLPKALENSEGFVWKQDPRWSPALPKTMRHPQYDDVYMAGEHSLIPIGIGLAGVFVESMAITAVGQILADLTGFAPSQPFSPVTCVGYAGERGWLGTCETPFDEQKGVYTTKCYFIGKYTIGRLLKQAFYAGWIGSLKF